LALLFCCYSKRVHENPDNPVDFPILTRDLNLQVYVGEEAFGVLLVTFILSTR